MSLILINHPRRVVELLESDELSPPEKPVLAIYDLLYLSTIILYLSAPQNKFVNDVRSHGVINVEYRDTRRVNV